MRNGKLQKNRKMKRSIHLVVDNILISATLTGDGVVLDAYEDSGDGVCIDSTWKLYNEMGIEVKEVTVE